MKTIKTLKDIGQRAKRWQKKPIIIRAIELKEDVQIHTREGVLMGYKGDFIIEGVEGEVYPCGREIFFKTYEEPTGFPNLTGL